MVSFPNKDELVLELQVLGFWRLLVGYPVRIAREFIRLLQNILTGKWRLPVNPPVFKEGTRRVLLVFSDNDPSSGAFRGGVDLAKNVISSGRYEVLAVLPEVGRGSLLLDEVGIPYVTVISAQWIIPNGRTPKSMVYDLVGRFYRNMLAIPKLVKLIHDYKIDIVHINTTFSYVGALAARVAGVKLVWHLRELLMEGRIVDEDYGHRLIASADRIVGMSKCICDKYRPIMPPGKLVCIYDGIDMKRFLAPKREILLPGKKPIFAMVGNYRPLKGHRILASACANLYSNGFHDFELWFIGQWVEEHCADIFIDAGMTDNVKFLGYQKNPELVLREADVAFMCSSHEAFGLVTVEAMLSGCLVIGANFFGTTEIIDHGETGLLFDTPDGESSGLEEQIRYALSHPEESRRMAANGQQKMAAVMADEVNAKKVITLYDEIFSGCNS